MSAAATWDRGASSACPAPERARPPRRHLRLVATGDDVGNGRGDLHLRRRGRLLLTLLAAAAVVTIAVVLASGRVSGDVMDHTVVVPAGATLSQVAAKEMPSLPLGEAVVRIQLANALSSLDVHAGQILEIPRAG